MEYFQDDLYPDTAVTWQPTMTCAEWLAGSDKQQKTQSLKPKDMKACKSFTLIPNIL